MDVFESFYEDGEFKAFEQVPEIELSSIFQKMHQVKAFVLDVDGVLTDGSLLITETGELLRTMHVRDGMAIKIALKEKYPFGIITGGGSAGVTMRLKNLGIEYVYTRREEKMPAFNDFLQKHALKPSEVLYMGDDVADVPVLRKAGLSVAPHDACPEVLDVADFVTAKNGGAGCVREVLEKVLRIQDKWPTFEEKKGIR